MRLADYLVAFWGLVFKDDLTGVIHNFGDRHRCHPPAFICEYGVCAGELQQADFAAAQSERKAVVLAGEAGDAQSLCHGNKTIPLRSVGVIIDPHVLQRFYGRNVVRVCQRAAHRYRAMEAPVIIHRFIRWAIIIRPAAGGKSGRYVPNQAGRGPVFFKSGKVSDRFNG